MKKIAIMTDSNSGITQSEAASLGLTVIPMPFRIDEKDYFEDINLTQEEFYEYLNSDKEVSTSQPSLQVITDTYTKLLEEYDQIVHIPMSSSLSGSCQTAFMIAKEDEFEGKVFVVDNQRISVTQRQSVRDALYLASLGKSGQEISDILTNDKFNSSIYIMLDTLYYLKKGGRITPAAAALGTLLKIKPVLQIQGEKLDAFSKARTRANGKTVMINAIRSDIDKRFGGWDENAKDRVDLHIAYTHDKEDAQKWLEVIKEEFPGFTVYIDPLSLSISCHIGPGALALACTQKLEIK